MQDKLTMLTARAKQSALWLWLLNIALQYTIPFNKPHAIKITRIGDNDIEVILPYIRKNQNHLQGMHACALATACEYACGLLLISRMDPAYYRLLMKNMRMDYKLQAKENVKIRFRIEEGYLLKLKEKISDTGLALEHYQIHAYNQTGEIICTAELEWQLKAWTKINEPLPSSLYPQHPEGE